MKKQPDLTGLVATKGNAAPAPDARSRAVEQEEYEESAANNVPLNFRVSADLRRRFRMYAARHDLKLNELLKLAFDEYESRH